MILFLLIEFNMISIHFKYTGIHLKLKEYDGLEIEQLLANDVSRLQRSL